MKRDPALICYILERVLEACKATGAGISSDSITSPDAERAAIDEHVLLCVEGDLIDAAKMPGRSQNLRAWQIFRLTWKGHDYLEAYEQRQRCHEPVRPWTSAREFIYKPE